jgi:Ca-activated chloride channel family protein
MRRFTNPSLAAPQPARTPDNEVRPPQRSASGALCFQALVKKQSSHPERSAAQSKDLRLHSQPSRNSPGKTGVPHISLPVFRSWGCGGISLTALLLGLATLQLPAQTNPPKPPPLTVDRDPVRSPDPDTPAAPAGEITKRGSGYVVHADVEEVSLNVTVLDNKGAIVQDLKREDFKVLEDGVQQNLLSFQHADIPVSIGLVIDNSGSMYKKRPSVNKSALDLILASNPKDEAFVVNFADDAYIDQDLTGDPNKLKDGLAHIESRGGTALYDAVVASADKLAADAHRPKQVIVIITDGEDNASTLNLEQAIRRVQQLSGPVIYSIGLLFGDEMSHGEVRHARRALEMLSGETGGIAFFPKSLDQVDQIAAEVARDIRSQYTLAYHSSKPSTDPGFRKVTVIAQSKGQGKLNVRTRTGYFPSIKNAKPAPATH